MSLRVITVDCNYVRPRFAAAYLLVDGGEAAFVDNNTAHAVPLLLEALKREGLTPEQVRYAIVTHVHLDHAGGTSALMKACPRAQCLAHPKAARHLIDPGRLVRSAKLVYGVEPFERMYGVIEPIAAERVTALADGATVPFGGGQLSFLHTRGHANHHMCVREPETASIFTGDSFGLAYPALQRAGVFVFPSTSPTDFNYEEAVASVERILATGARTAYPTHFGAVTELRQAAAQMREHLDFAHALLARDHGLRSLKDAELEPYLKTALWDFMRKAAERRGLQLSDDDLALLEMDLELNAQGLAYALIKARNPSPKAE